MKISVATNLPHFMISNGIVKELKKRGLFSETNPDVVINIDPVHGKFTRGKKTILWELDDFLNIGKPHYDEIAQYVDIRYINHASYLEYYPEGTKVLPTAIDPDILPIPGEPIVKYIFVGSIEPIGIYQNRLIELNKLFAYGEDFYITNGKDDFNSHLERIVKGEVFVDVLPSNPDNGLSCLHTKIYQAMALSCVMVKFDPILNEQFVKDVHYVTLEKFGKITRLQADKIHRESREYVLKHHTLSNRVDTILQDL